MHRVEFRRDETQTSGFAFSGQSHNQCIILPATIYDNTYMVLPTKEARLSFDILRTFAGRGMVIVDSLRLVSVFSLQLL